MSGTCNGCGAVQCYCQAIVDEMLTELTFPPPLSRALCKFYPRGSLWPRNLATCIREAAIGCAGFDMGATYGFMHGRNGSWSPGCNIPRPITPNAEGEKP